MDFYFTMSIWAVPREAQWWLTAFEGWTDKEWRANFRMRKTTFLSLCDILHSALVQQQCHYRKALSVEQPVAIYLWGLATNVEYRTISLLFGVGLSTACTVTNQTTGLIREKMLNVYIKRTNGGWVQRHSKRIPWPSTRIPSMLWSNHWHSYTHLSTTRQGGLL